MSALTVKELKNLIREAKKNDKQCKPYSKLKKKELLDHARELGLIESPKGETPEDKRINENLKRLSNIEDLVNKQNPRLPTGIKRKESAMRRIQKVKEAIKSGEVQSKIDAFLNKIKIDTDNIF